MVERDKEGERGIRMRNMQRETRCLEVACRAPHLQHSGKQGCLEKVTVKEKWKEPVAFEPYSGAVPHQPNPRLETATVRLPSCLVPS